MHVHIGRLYARTSASSASAERNRIIRLRCLGRKVGRVNAVILWWWVTRNRWAARCPHDFVGGVYLRVGISIDHRSASLRAW